MGVVTTHTEGRVVTHSDDDQRPVEVVLLPARDAAAQGAAGPTERAPRPSATAAAPLKSTTTPAPTPTATRAKPATRMAKAAKKRARA